MSPVVSLHRYWIWANRSREYFEQVVGSVAATDAAGADGWFASDIGLFLTRWYAALFVVIEGWRELGFTDQAIDELLESPWAEQLRRFRHGVCHFQSEYFDDRFTGFIADPASADWVRQIHREFGRYLSGATAMTWHPTPIEALAPPRRSASA